MSDEGLHEIQLNGKQLVFLFMAATVVAVVIFLCGVMVGRGADARLAAAAADTSGFASLDATAFSGPATASSINSSGLVTAGETLTYPGLLEDAEPPAETLISVDDVPAGTAAVPEPAPEPEASSSPSPAPVPAPAPSPTPAPPSPSPVAAQPLAAGDEPPGNGFVVQVAATRDRAEADTIARRLSTKGYPAFVMALGSAGATMFRVRVGKYDDRREAESVAGRLEREERFDPWITR